MIEAEIIAKTSAQIAKANADYIEKKVALSECRLDMISAEPLIRFSGSAGLIGKASSAITEQWISYRLPDKRQCSWQLI